MAQIALVSIYGANGNDWKANQGISMGFPTQSILVRALPQPTSYSGVSCLSQIQLLPYGPSPIEPVYYSPLSVSAIQTLCNA